MRQRHKNILNALASFPTVRFSFQSKQKGAWCTVGKSSVFKSLRTGASEYNVSQSLPHCVFSLGNLQSSSKFTRAWCGSVALQIRVCQPHWRCINVRGEKYISCHFKLWMAFYFLPLSAIPPSFQRHRKVINLQQRHGLAVLPCGWQNGTDF